MGAESEASSPVVTIVAVVVLTGALMMLLRWLLKVAEKYDMEVLERIERLEQERKMTNDPFRARNGYNWDWVIVFKVYEEAQKLNDYQKDHSMRWVLTRLAQGGLQSRLFYSIQCDEVYCKIRADKTRIEKYADAINYKLELDPDALQVVCERGRDGKWSALTIEDKYDQSQYSPWSYIHARYEYARDEVANLYKKFPNGTVFRGVDRIKLIMGIMSARRHEGGCHLDFNRMMKEKAILAYFPLHDRKELMQLEHKWLNFWMVPWNQPFDDIKDYFGEKIGLYFLWLGHYTTWLILPAILGFGAWINVAVENNNPNAKTVPYFAVFVALWATFFLEYWKRKENRYAMFWGMTGFEEEEQARPQFIGEVTKSPIDGSETLYFPRGERFRRVASSQSFIFGLIIVVVGVVASIFVLKYFMVFKWGMADIGSIVASLANAVQIQVMNIVYGGLALKLNDYENHRTDTEYEDSLIAKTFVFQFVNSYASLFYIAFIKGYTDDKCLDGCMDELATALGTIFLTRLAVGNLTEVGVPYIKSVLKTRKETAGTDGELTDCEKDFMAEEYHVMLGTFGDFSEMMIQFGYATLFVAAFPLCMIMSLINNWVEIRVDGWKLCQLCRRPEPRSAEDIGTWYTILELMSTAAVITNSALIVFTGDQFNNTKDFERVWYFVLFEHCLFMVKYALAIIVPDVPFEVDIQLARQSFIISKVIDNAEDENDDDLAKDISVELDLTIRKTDDDPL